MATNTNLGAANASLEGRNTELSDNVASLTTRNIELEEIINNHNNCEASKSEIEEIKSSL